VFRVSVIKYTANWLSNDHPEKMNEGKLGIMNRNEFLSGWVGVVCFLSLSAVVSLVWGLSTKR
jgi:hypothetical protein